MGSGKQAGKSVLVYSNMERVEINIIAVIWTFFQEHDIFLREV